MSTLFPVSDIPIVTPPGKRRKPLVDIDWRAWEKEIWHACA